MSLYLEYPVSNERKWSAKINANLDKIDACIGKIAKIDGTHGLSKSGGELKLKLHSSVGFNGSGALYAANSGATTVSGMSDVTIQAPANGQYLRYNSSSAKWTNQAGGMPPAFFSQLTKTSFISPASGHVIRYNGSVWANAAATLYTLGNLTDAAMTPNNKYRVTYAAGSSKWNTTLNQITSVFSGITGTTAISSTISYNSGWKKDIRALSAPSNLFQDGMLYLNASVDGECTNAIIVPDTGPVQFPFGVKFGGSAQICERFEEGDFTPMLRGATNPGAFTYNKQIGKYFIIGRVCTVEILLDWSNSGSASGAIEVYNLPYISNATSFGFGDCILEGVTYSGTQPCSYIQSNSSAIRISNAPMVGADLGAPISGKAWISITYTTQ